MRRRRRRRIYRRPYRRSFYFPFIYWPYVVEWDYGPKYTYRTTDT